jgi:hypothetical protein
MTDCPICDGSGPECKGTGDDPVNRCEFCAEESEDGCHNCEIHWCFACRYEHACPEEAGEPSDGSGER